MLLYVHRSPLAAELEVLGDSGLGAAAAIEDFSESVKVVLILLELRLLASDMRFDLREPVQSNQRLLLILVDLAMHRRRMESAAASAA